MGDEATCLVGRLDDHLARGPYDVPLPGRRPLGVAAVEDGHAVGLVRKHKGKMIVMQHGARKVERHGRGDVLYVYGVRLGHGRQRPACRGQDGKKQKAEYGKRSRHAPRIISAAFSYRQGIGVLQILVCGVPNRSPRLFAVS